MTEAELGAKMLAQARAEKHRPGLPVNPAKNCGAKRPERPRARYVQPPPKDVIARRKKVLPLVLKGLKQTEIAAMLNVSHDAISRDVKRLREEGRL